MQKSDAARIIAGLTSAETKQSSAPTSVHVMSGEVVGNSESGKVQIRMDGDVVSPDDEQIIEIDALGGLEEGDTATILLTGQPGRAMTPMAMGSSGSVDRIVERISGIEADYVKATLLEADVARIGFLKASELEAEVAEFGYLKADELEADVATFGYLKVDELEAEVAEFGYLKADSATITDLQADTAKIHNLSADDISAASGYIHDLTSSNITAQNIVADHGTITNLDSNYAHIRNGVIDNAKISYADVNDLNAHYAHIQNGVIDNAKIGYADVNNLNAHYAQIDMANVSNAWIQNGLIRDAAIKSQMVDSISASQLTAGEIDADEITVRNLKASSLTVQTADGYVYVGEKKIPTKEFIDSLKNELQNEIDGAIETFTVTAIPTLSNTPAKDWVVSGDAEATKKLRMKHVGDIAYVVNSGSSQNGYCYRFAYDTTNQEFKWVLIKDSDVTAALSRLSDAEGKITGLESFESETTSWIDTTDDGLTEIRTNHTNLVGRVSTVEGQVALKVDSTTFKEVKDTVDEQSTTITSLTNKTETLANPNLLPFFSDTPIKAGKYWSGAWTYWPSANDGWGTFSNSVTAATNRDLANLPQERFEVGKTYTILLEWRNVELTGTATMYTYNAKNAQISAAVEGGAITITEGSGSDRRVVECVLAHDAEGVTRSLYWRTRLQANSSLTGEFRLSIYEGEYEGPYKPYIPVTEHYTTSNTVNSVKQTADSNDAYIKNLTTTLGINADGTEKETTTYKYNQLSQTLEGTVNRVGTVETNIDNYVSVRLRMVRDKWTDDTWSNHEAIGYASVYANQNAYTTGNVATGFDGTKLKVGDLIVIEGVSTDTSTPHSITCKVTAVPASATANISLTTVTATSSAGLQERISTAETSIEQNANDITLTAMKSESMGNMLYDTDVPTTDKVYGPADRYFSDNGQKSTTTVDFVTLSDPPEPGIQYAAQFVCNGENTTASNRGLTFYDAVDWTSLPLVEGQAYSVSYWARCTSGTGYARVSRQEGSSVIYVAATKTVEGQTWTSVEDIGREWRHISSSFTHETKGANYDRIWFRAYFPVGTAGTVQLCGFKLVPQAYATAAQLKVANDAINLRVEKDDVINQINLSDESATINATRVDIEGATIFTGSGRLSSTSLNNAYDAKGAANTAKSEAISTAATDATNKANAAKSDAISAAATDATNKANAVQENLDNLQVGGRNLLLGTADPTNNETYRLRSTLNGDGSIRLTPTTSAAYCKWKVDYLNYVDYVGETVTFGIDAKVADVSSSYTNPNVILYVDVQPQDRVNTNISSTYERYYGKTFTDLTAEWKRFTITVKVPDNLTSGSTSALVAGNYLTVQVAAGGSKPPVDVRLFKLEKGNRATDWTPAPEDTVSRTQRIYYRKNESGAPPAPSAWVTKGVDNKNYYDQWTVKVPPLKTGTDRYAYLYTCEQFQIGNGTLDCTTVLLDENATIIDGASVITGSITANKLEVYDATIGKIRADAIDTKSISIGDLSGSIGGRNFLLDSANLTESTWKVSKATVTAGQADPDGGTNAILINPSAATWYFGSSSANTIVKDVGERYTFSVWLKAASATTADVCMRYLKGDSPYSSTATRQTVSLSTSWQKFFITGELITAQGADNVWFGQQSTVDVYAYHPKLEKGDRATDWTPAPEDQIAYADGVGAQSVQPNLLPFFSDTPIEAGKYWSGSWTYWPSANDGWGAFSNSVTSATNRDFANLPQERFEAGKTYTILLEWRNVELTGTATMYTYNANNAQISAFVAGGAITITDGSGSDRRVVECVRAHDAEGVTRSLYWRTRLQANSSLTGEFRLSIYEGEYEGPYKPYVSPRSEITDAGKTATNYISANSSGIKIANANPSTAETYQLQTATGTDFVVAGAVRNRINGDGMTLYDGTGVADSDIMAKFTSSLVELGKNSQDAVMKFCNGKLRLSYYNDTSRSIRYGDIYSEEMMALRSGYTESPASETGTRLGSVTTSLIEESSKVVSKIASYWYNVSSSSNSASISTFASGTEGNNYCYMDVNVGHNGSRIKLTLDDFFVGVDQSNTSGPTLELDSSGFAINGSTPIKAVYADTTVVTLSDGQWLQVASANTVTSKLGSGASQSNTICIAQNGDFNTYAGVVTGAMGQDGSARAYIYPNRTGAIRINFILIRFA